jgi:zinc protease
MAHGFELVEREGGVSRWRHGGNGLEVLVCATPVAPVVGFGVVYRVGSRFEVAGQTGATHILEHLMFKGSERFNRERGTDIARVLHRVGASFNATTWLDRTNYYEVVPVDQLGLAVDIEADRMRGALIRAADLESERSVVLNELDSGDNDPVELLMKSSFAHAFLEHTYHHPTIGWRGDVERMTAEVLRGFYDTYYHPNNATVVVVGDVDEGSALDEVERAFGGLAPAPGPFPEVAIRESAQRGERRFEIHRAGEIGALALTWHIPEGLHDDLPALSVLTQILGEGVTSRLYQRLVETNRCLGVHAFAMELHDPGVFQIFATLAPEISHSEVEEIVRGEIATLRSQPPTAEEVARSLAQTRTDLAFHHESPAQIMAGLTEAVAMGDWRRFVRELEDVRAVSADDLRRVAGAYLTDGNLTVGWFVPDGTGGTVQNFAGGPRPCFLKKPFAERASTHELPGGAKLTVLANPHAPTVTIAGTLHAGPALAADGRWSVPGLTASMLDRGTAGHDRLGLARELEDHGLQLGFQAAASTPLTISFSAQGLAEELPRLASLLMEALRQPTFPTDELDKLREQVLGGLVRERQETFARGFAALTRRLYPPGHPLHRRAIEAREKEVKAVDRDDLEAFHAATYGPSTMVLAVVGEVEAEEVAALFADRLAGWTGGEIRSPEFAADEEPPASEELIQIDDRPNLEVFLGHRGGLRRGDPQYAAAVLANSCLGQSTLTSRLGLAVRDREGLTYGIYSRFFGTLQLAGPWATFFGVNAANLERAVELSRSVIADFVAAGPTEEELADERFALAGAYRVGLATNAGVARELVTSLTAGEGVDRLDRYPEELLATGRDEVMAAIRRHLHPERLVLTAAGDLEGEEVKK